MMWFPCDEAGGLEFQETVKENWKISTVGGVLIGYETRCWWKENYKRFPKKAKDYSIDQMDEILQALRKFKSLAICQVIHQSTVSSKVTQSK